MKDTKTKKLKVNDKVYDIQNKKLVIKVRTWALLLLLPSIVLLVLGTLLLIKSLNLKGEETKLLYNEIGNVDYKVYLKENDFYKDDYLDKGMKYVANLISSVKPEFTYELHSTETLDLAYKYKIDADLIITDINDTTPLKVKKYKLLNEKEVSSNSDNFRINETVDIDYDEYNAYVNQYKKELGLVVDAKLRVYMTVETLGNMKGVKESLNSNKTLQITIPLSEKTLDITIDNDKINTSDSITINTGVTVVNLAMFVSGIVIGIIGMALLIVAIIIYNKYKKNDPYTVSLRNIFKQYDRLIVNAKYGESDIDLDKCTSNVTVEKFSELVDAARNDETSIIWIEKIPGEESIFVVMKDNKAIVFNLTLAWLRAHKKEDWY